MELEEIRSNILQIAEDAIKYARDMNIPSAEAFVFKQNRIDVNEQKGKISARGGRIEGVGLRVAIGKKVGFSSCTGFTKSALKASLEKAYQIAQKSPETPNFPGFIASNHSGQEGILDPEILQIEADKLIADIDIALDGLDLSNDLIVAVDNDFTVQWHGYAIATTEGCHQATLHTSHENSSGVILAKGNQRKTYYETRSGRTYQDLAGIANFAFQKAMNSLDNVPFGKSEKLTLILHPKTASIVFSFAMNALFDGSTYVQKANPLQEKLGSQIAPKWLNLYDNGQDVKSIGTVAIDTEGSSVQRTQIISDGIFKTFLYDHRYGNAAETSSTGNAVRTTMFGGIPFEQTPLVGAHKFMINPGKKDFNQIIAEHDHAIYIEGYPKGLHTANVLSGDFSLISNNAFLVKNGEIQHPLDNISLSGNFVKALEKITMVGNDIARTALKMDAPTMVIDDISFSS
ncbi:MAG: TldD/PmbA family protein [Promethearchaeati archaeon]